MNEFRAEGGFFIFTTESNSCLLFGELATKLSGRCVEFEVQVLSFKECREIKRSLGRAVCPNPVTEFDRYILEDDFSKALDYSKMTDKHAYVGSAIREIFEKDIRRRLKVKNVSVFSWVRDYVINNFGAMTSLTNTLFDLERQGVCIKCEKFNYCFQILEDARIASRCTRFGIKSCKLLPGSGSIAFADLDFCFTFCPTTASSSGWHLGTSFTAIRRAPATR